MPIVRCNVAIILCIDVCKLEGCVPKLIKVATTARYTKLGTMAAVNAREQILANGYPNNASYMYG